MQETRIATSFPRLRRLWADGGYPGEWLTLCKLPEGFPLRVEIVEREPGTHTQGFELLPNRWVVERTFAWRNHFQFRRLSKDYEYWVYTADAMIYAAMVRLMLGRLARH